jgi:cytochrome-b5 reductase
MVNGVYIPSSLLVVGTYIVKQEWLPFALGLAALLSGWKILSNSASFATTVLPGITC